MNTYNICVNDSSEIATIGLTVINGGYRYAILKIEESGQELFKKNWFYPYHAMYGGYSGSLHFKNSRYYNTGWSIDTALNFKGVLTVWDREFNLILDKQYAINDSNTIFLSSFTDVNQVVVTGYISVYSPSAQHHQNQLLLLQLDTLGNKIWERSYTAKPGLWHLQGNSIIATQDGGYAVSGNAYNYAIYPSYTSYVLLTDSFGNKIVDRYLKYENFGSYSMGIQQKANGNYIVAFVTTYISDAFSEHLSRKLIIEELDKDDLTTVWKKEYSQGYLNGLVINRLIPQNDSTFLIAGYYSPDEVLHQGEYAAQLGFIFAITENGDSLWYRDYLNGTEKWEYNYLNDIAITPDGGIVGAGRIETSNSPFTGGFASHVWLFKTDSIGCLYAGCDTVYHTPKPPVTEVKVYPNPAMAGQDLIIEMPNVASATATVYNSSGQIIMQTEIQFSDGIATLSPQNRFLKGLYLLHLQTDAGNNYVEKIAFY